MATSPLPSRDPRGAAYSNSRPQPGAKTFGGLEGGGGVGGLAGQLPGSLERGTPTYIPQHDPHDMLVILNIHKWVEIFFRKIFPLAQAPISQGRTQRSGQGSKFFLCFSNIFKFSTKF